MAKRLGFGGCVAASDSVLPFQTGLKRSEIPNHEPPCHVLLCNHQSHFAYQKLPSNERRVFTPILLMNRAKHGQESRKT